jgi:hypothetical protein
MHVITSGLKSVFGPSYVSMDGNPDFANLHCSIEYPIDPQNYPGVWVDFEPEGELSRGGIDDINSYLQNGDSSLTPLYLWRAQGWATYTLAALTSLQRARLHDEIVRVFAFGSDPTVAAFRETIEDNDFLAMNMDFDRIAERGATATPGTPWGSEEIIYEVTLAMQCVIEFYSTANKDKLYPISEIRVLAGVDGTDFSTEMDMTAAGVIVDYSGSYNVPSSGSGGSASRVFGGGPYGQGTYGS